MRSPAPTTPIIKSSGHETNHSHNRHDHDHHYNELEHHHKKSVLAKVREKAKKWKQVLTKKKHGHEGEGNMTPTSPINLDVDDEGVDQDPEYYGAPSNCLYSFINVYVYVKRVICGCISSIHPCSILLAHIVKNRGISLANV